MTSQQVRPVMTADLAVAHEHRFDGPDGCCRCGLSEEDVTGG